MDTVKILKFQATHKNKRHHRPLSSLFLYFLTALTCSLFCSSPLWLPSLSSSMKVFLFVSVPKIGSVFLSPEFVFILGNLIVVALIGEFKIFSSVSSPSDIVNHAETIKRCQCQNLQSYSTHKETEVEQSNMFVEERVLIKRTCGEVEAIEGKVWDEESKEVEKVNEDIDDEEEDEDATLSDDQQLNKRADDFIARVAERRRFEALCNGE